MNAETKFRLELEDMGIDWETSHSVVQKVHDHFLAEKNKEDEDLGHRIGSATYEIERALDVVRAVHDGLLKGVREIGKELKDEDLEGLAEDYEGDVEDARISLVAALEDLNEK